MKRIFLILIFLISCSTSFAQWFAIPNLTTFDDRRLHFGFTLGINTMDYSYRHFNTVYDNPAFYAADSIPFREEIDSVHGMIRSDIASLVPGFTVGIVTNLRLTQNLDLRFLPGLSFGNRKMSFNIPIHDSERNGIQKTNQSRATFLDFPLLLKYKSKRIVNHRPYMIGGVALRYDISHANDLIRLKKTLFSVETGMGWDLYLQFFRLSTELKYSFGIGNTLSSKLPQQGQYQYYQMSFKRLTANVFTLSFHFE